MTDERMARLNQQLENRSAALQRQRDEDVARALKMRQEHLAIMRRDFYVIMVVTVVVSFVIALVTIKTVGL